MSAVKRMAGCAALHPPHKVLTGGYGAGWAVCAIAVLWVGISLFAPARD